MSDYRIRELDDAIETIGRHMGDTVFLEAYETNSHRKQCKPDVFHPTILPPHGFDFDISKAALLQALRNERDSIAAGIVES